MDTRARYPTLAACALLCSIPLLSLILPLPVALLVPASPWIYCRVSMESCPALFQQSEYSEALKKGEAALACGQELGSFVVEMGGLACMEAAYVGQSRYDEFLATTQQALALANEQNEPMLVGASLVDMGFAYFLLGRYSEAMLSLEKALGIHREIGYRPGQANAHTNLGNVFLAQGDHEQAQVHYEQALRICREDGRWDLALMPLLNLAVVYETQLRIAEAVAHYQQARELVRRSGSPDQEATILINFANLHVGFGRYDEALETYEQALEIFREVENRAGEELVLHNIGATYLSAFKDHERAMEFFEKSLGLAQDLGNPASVAVGRISIGNVFSEQKDYTEAENMYRQALNTARELPDQAMQALCLGNIGATYQEQMRYEEALDKYREALDIVQRLGDPGSQAGFLGKIGSLYESQERYDEALQVYFQALEILETIRPRLGSQQSRVAFATGSAELYARTVGLLYRQGELETALLVSEQGRARALLDSLATGRAILTDDELAPHVLAGNPDTAWLQDTVSIEPQADYLAGLVGGSDVALQLLDVQELLDDQTTVLSFFVLDESVLVFVVTKTGFTVADLQIPRQTLTTRIMGWRESITDVEDLNAIAVQQWSEILYQDLIAPVSDSLQTERVIIVPHGPTHYLPFAALRNPDTGQYFVEERLLILLPSASALPFIQQNARTPSSSPPSSKIPVLVLGNPATGDPDLITLHGAEEAAWEIGGLYGAVPLVGRDATEGAVWKYAAEAQVLHLAAHARYIATRPLLSYIALAPDAEHDGQLQVHEVYGLDLRNTDLVVLSACETQLGDLSAGDEVVGLTRAFFSAGASSVIATLWQVNDPASGELMQRFHSYLRRGLGKAAALRQAQLDLLGDPEYAAPYYWSGFVLSGDGGPWE